MRNWFSRRQVMKGLAGGLCGFLARFLRAEGSEIQESKSQPTQEGSCTSPHPDPESAIEVYSRELNGKVTTYIFDANSRLTTVIDRF